MADESPIELLARHLALLEQQDAALAATVAAQAARISALESCVIGMLNNAQRDVRAVYEDRPNGVLQAYDALNARLREIGLPPPRTNGSTNGRGHA